MASVGELVTDDDTTRRPHCCHQSMGGKLRDIVPQLKYLADPSHRVKVMIKSVFALVKKTKDPNTCKNWTRRD